MNTKERLEIRLFQVRRQIQQADLNLNRLLEERDMIQNELSKLKTEISTDEANEIMRGFTF